MCSGSDYSILRRRRYLRFVRSTYQEISSSESNGDYLLRRHLHYRSHHLYHYSGNSINTATPILYTSALHNMVHTTSCAYILARCLLDRASSTLRILSLAIPPHSPLLQYLSLQLSPSISSRLLPPIPSRLSSYLPQRLSSQQSPL
jgi:hypothetical protein